MADTGKQSPLGVNVTSSLLQNIGFNINPVAASYMGSSKTNASYTFGKCVQDTCLRLLTWAIHDGYNRGVVNDATYNNLISIGVNPTVTLPALGNAKPPSYELYDPSGVWVPAPGSSVSMVGGTGAATTGYAITNDPTRYQGQSATWIPYDTTNDNKSITQWGFIRCIALQAWNEYNYNGGSPSDPFSAGTGASASGVTRTVPEYKEFCSSFMAVDGFLSYSNQNIYPINLSKTFLKGTYSNMPDLITGDITNVNLATKEFGIDLMSLGQALDLSTIKSFGKPSNLLQTLYKNNAVTQELTLALLAAGLDQVDIDNIGFGIRPAVSVEQEKLIYGAFLIIVEQNLKQICSILNCNTVNLLTLADLLNVQKMFPTSFASLTVPLYNSTVSPTNSKTYYFIYRNGGLNSQLISPAIATQVGTLPTDIFPTTTDATTQTDPTSVNIQEEPIGFGSNLVNILPNEIAVAASAFSYSMQQIRNIEKTNIQDFAQVVYSMEGTQNLPLINSGTDVPVNTTLQNQGQIITGLGSGPRASYTMSDFFGSMSGLPYPWENIYNYILKIQTQKLINIYNQLFLAVTWEKAYCTIATNPYSVNVQQYIAPNPSAIPPVAGQPRIDDLYYTVTITQGGIGGGYGRGTAPNPTVTLSPNNCGASVLITDVGRNDKDAASLGGGTFGRVKFSISNGTAYQYKTVTNSLNNNAPSLTGANAPPVESITVQAPPTATLAVTNSGAIATGGTNTTGDTYYSVGSPTIGTAGWPTPMNSVVQSYIDQANEEIRFIVVRSRGAIVDNSIGQLAIAYDTVGRQLKIEQRARFIALSPVPVPRDPWVNTYPTSLYVFTDNIPTYAQNTMPHMHAQTLEAIANLSSVGGQSIVGMMRQERNQARLNEIGLQLDNNVPTDLASFSTENTTQLLLNGTTPEATPDTGITCEEKDLSYTNPAWQYNIGESGQILNPTNVFVYDSVNGVSIAAGNNVLGSIGTVCDPGNIIVVGSTVPTGPYLPVVQTLINTNFIGNFTTSNPVILTPVQEGNANLILTTGNSIFVTTDNLDSIVTIVANANISNLSANLDGGNANLNLRDLTVTGNRNNFNGGSFISTTPKTQGSLKTGRTVLRPELDLTLTRSTFTASPNVAEAIGQVIDCNCDCWLI